VPADAKPADAGGPCTFGPWGAPKRLAGVGSNANEWGPALSADKLTLYFESERTGIGDLYRATRATTADEFGAVTALTQLNGNSSSERDPELSADGLTLYFTSDRNGQPQLFRATRTSPTAEFGTPTKVNELANVALAGPALRFDGGELFYSDWLQTTLIHATYMTGQGFVPNGNINILDVGFANAQPSLSADGLTLYYQHMEGAFSTCEIYMATRPNLTSPFGTPVPVAALADSKDTGNPEISKDGTTIVFASARDGGAGGTDLYMAERACQ
jgi:Tol biopolymer transport system component